MPREIKFRYWNNAEKKLYLQPESGWSGFPIKYSEKDEWLQYTGLKDKNGKEIYEGHVVTIPGEYTEGITDDGCGPIETANHLSEIVFQDGAFGFLIREYGDSLSRGFYTWDKLQDNIDVKEIEVIGNIYENPELIQPT